MPRVVHDDHRPEEFGQLGYVVADRDAGRRTENVGVAADMVDVVVASQRPVARARVVVRLLGYLPERDRLLATQRGKGPVAEVVVLLPEVPRAQIDLRE